MGPLGRGGRRVAVPWGIAVDGVGVVYVSERDNDRVQRFSADGTFLGALTRAGSGLGATRTPDGIAIGPQGNAYVADSGNFRLQELPGQTSPARSANGAGAKASSTSRATWRSTWQATCTSPITAPRPTGS